MIKAIVLDSGRGLNLPVKFSLGDASLRHSSQTAEQSFSARLTRSMFLMPVFLAVAALTVYSVSAVTEVMTMALVLGGVILVLLAGRVFLQNDKLFSLLALGIYGIFLTSLNLYSVTVNPLLWALVLALPLECWLVSRKRTAITIGVIAAGVIAGISVVASLAQITTMSVVLIIATAGLLVYIAGLLYRITNTSLHATESDENQLTGATDLEEALDAMVLRLDNDGYILSLSERSTQQFGIETQVLSGTLLLDRVHVADRVVYLSFLAGLRGNPLQGSFVKQAEVRLRCLDVSAVQPKVFFESFRLEGQLHGTMGVENAAAGFILVAHNLAQENALREQTITQREEIRNLEHSRDNFLNTVSHELRTPLNSIIGFSDLLLHDVAGPLPTDKQREYVDLIKMSGTHLLNVVNSILEASRLEAGQYVVEVQKFPLKDSVGLCTSMLKPLADQKNVQLCERIQADVGDIIADQRAVQQILINLMSNAIKFTEQGGCVTIDAALKSVDKSYHYRQRSELLLSVSDTGIGLSREEIARLCHPFSQINNVQTRMQEGSGLGLYVVKGLVQLLGGKLEIKSNKGEGTTVCISLPLGAVSEGTTDNMLGSFNSASAATIIDMQTLQDERRFDASANIEQGQTQGDIHAQKRKTG